MKRWNQNKQNKLEIFGNVMDQWFQESLVIKAEMERLQRDLDEKVVAIQHLTEVCVHLLVM